MYMFTVTLTKDSRVTTQDMFVTIIDSNYYPRCNLTLAKQDSINAYSVVSANCLSTIKVDPPSFTFLWSLYDLDTLIFITETNQMINNMPSLRIPPYVLSQYKEVLVRVVVTAGSQYSTPIGLYMKSNDQSFFTKGSISINYNTFTAYLSNFVMTPSSWNSGLSDLLFFQYRIRESDTQYRVLLSPLEASLLFPISTILPPLTYENLVYIDVIDTLGNNVTIY
jgi:hypothetical protein